MHRENGVCAWCVYFRPNEPTDWEATEFNDKPTLRCWQKACRKLHGADACLDWEKVTGRCLVAPEKIDVIGGDGCAQYLDRSLPSPTDLVTDYCGGSYQSQRLRWADSDIKKLKKQLIVCRERSRKRFDKLQVLKAKSSISRNG
jgi:hypothetical protein